MKEERDHECRFAKWDAAPYDHANAVGAYYKLTCLECYKALSESFIPSTFEIIDLKAERERLARTIQEFSPTTRGTNQPALE